MSDLLLLSEAQMRRVDPYFPIAHGIARVHDRMVISGLMLILTTELREVAWPNSTRCSRNWKVQ